MRKVAILTINDDGNYGNRLQNYAVQQVLTTLNTYVETINNQLNIVGKNVWKKYIKNKIKKILNTKEIKRYNCFMQFNKNINFSKINIDKNHIPKNLVKKYDYFITGSDQVWNPTLGRMSDIDFLTFAVKEKRIAFSASFGIMQIPKEKEDYYKERLEGIKYISVREERGKEIIKELTGRTEVEVLVDPTMLLSSNQWNEVSKRPRQLKNLKFKKYILNYFLGELSEEWESEIKKVAKENNCEIINILDKDSPFYQTGPSEFLYLEKNAFLICTDSFHSSVFSIIYDTPFIVFERKQRGLVSMNSRIDTLLSKFKLKNRRFDGKITDELLHCDYTEAKKILEKEKEKSINFLKRVLDM